MTMIYYDGDPDFLVGKTVGVLGYGDMGQAFALNMRDSGLQVVVSVHDDATRAIAESHGVTILPAADVVQLAGVLVLALPDETMPMTYIEQVSPHLQRGHMLIFTSAYNVAFGFIEPPPFVDVGLVAPRTTGFTVRQFFVEQRALSSFVAVGQDASRNAWQTVLAVAAASGLVQGGAVEINFEQEAELNLFVQQALIPVFHHTMLTAASLLMRSGYPAEAALQDLYLSGKFRDYLTEVSQKGLLKAILQGTETNQYATLSRLSRFSELKLERLMEVTLEEIRSGEFAREWGREYTDANPRLNKLVKAQETLDLWDWEQQTLDLLGENPEE